MVTNISSIVGTSKQVYTDFFVFCSPALCNDFLKRDNHIPAVLRQFRTVPRHVKQRTRLHEATRRAEDPWRARHGLHCVDVGHHQGHRRNKGKTPPI